MKFINPIQMNDWNIKDIILVVLIFQLIIWLTAIVQFSNIHVPVIRELASFIALFFLNGVLILRALNIHGLGNIKTILYSVGLSIASLMFFGMLIRSGLSITRISKTNFINTFINNIHHICIVFMCFILFKRPYI